MSQVTEKTLVVFITEKPYNHNFKKISGEIDGFVESFCLVAAYYGFYVTS